MSLSLDLIRADIKTARNNLSPIVNFTNDEMMYNIAAYHAQQATEKCIKIVLSQYYGLSENSRPFRTHNIADLIGMLEDCEEGGNKSPIVIPEYIKVMSAEITVWEASVRYNDNIVILRDNIRKVIRECETMLSDLKKAGFK